MGLKMSTWWKNFFDRNNKKEKELDQEEKAESFIEVPSSIDEFEEEFDELFLFDEEEIEFAAPNNIKESELRNQFKKETGKNVIWGGKITGNYIKYRDNFIKETGKVIINDITESL